LAISPKLVRTIYFFISNNTAIKIPQLSMYNTFCHKYFRLEEALLAYLECPKLRNINLMRNKEERCRSPLLS